MGPRRVEHRPSAVLLDSGGVFFLPDPSRIAGAFHRAEVPVPSDDLLDRAHHRAAARFSVDRDAEREWDRCWNDFLHEYVVACTEHLDELIDLDELHRHLDPEFSQAALWSTPIHGAADGLRRLADSGLQLGVVSNADGAMASRLAEREILQVGPGPGVEVACVIDSGEVGVMKPDRRIFELALDRLGVAANEAWYVGDMAAIDVVGARRAGIRPWLMDPHGFHHDADYDRVGSLDELAAIVEAAG